MMNSREAIFFRIIRFIFILFLILSALHLRIATVDKTVVPTPLIKDAADYFIYAHNLKNHHTFSSDTTGLDSKKKDLRPDAVRSPGYPLFLYLFIKDTPTLSILNQIYLVQGILSSLTVLLAFLLFEPFLGFKGSLAASFLIAFCPHLIANNVYLLSEPFFTFLLIIACFIFALFLRKSNTGILLLSGILFGIADLTRPSLVFFPFFLSIFFFVHFKNEGWKQKSVLFIVAFFIMSVPWSLRNILILGKISDEHLRINFLHHGMYPNFMYENRPHTYSLPYTYDPESPKISRSQTAFLKEIYRRFRLEPKKYLKWYLIHKPIAFWSWNVVQGFKDVFIYPISTTPYWTDSLFIWSRWIMRFLHAPLVVFGLIGCLLSWFRSIDYFKNHKQILIARFFSLLLLYYTLLHMIGAPFPRYSVPLRPYIYAMAIFSFISIFRCMQSRLLCLKKSDERS